MGVTQRVARVRLRQRELVQLDMNTDSSFCAVVCNSTRKDCKMALLQMSSVEEAAEALVVRFFLTTVMFRK